MRRKPGLLEEFARRASRWTGSSWAFGLAVGTIVVWLFTYPLFSSADSWQMVINTLTTLVTFLMVFLIQRSQNIEAHALQLKLNELVAAVIGASNRLINVEELSEQELEALHRHYHQLVHLARQDQDLTCSHSVEEARRRHERKRGGHREAS